MGEATQVSSLPLPPMQYVGLYTDENVQRGRAPSPPRPLHEGYSMFGAPFHGDEPVIRPLESQGIRRLYPQNYEHKKELKKLNHSLLVNFLDMVDILIRCPDTSKRIEKKEDMSLLFIHMHHLINEYRPHQARETLRVLLDMQRRQRLDTAHRFHKHLDKAPCTPLKGPLTDLDIEDELARCVDSAMAVVCARYFASVCHIEIC
ncbi:hypothetical protein HPB52_014066 [Rhipicephalus sanguineus]|uniref:Mediator of RNA polymerase II transcription subunit 7 n=1 Tax=Rhipicephalus sanguineus TaxID=34632 RepID=A0A9D4TAE4_RHISA|nr:hypothetical protein HPB52_014066 [Rhipicephalus sanguineus]